MSEAKTASNQVNYSELLHIAEANNSTENLSPSPPPSEELHYGWIIGICTASAALITVTGFIIAKKTQICCFKQKYYYDSDWVSEDSAKIAGSSYCCC